MWFFRAGLRGRGRGRGAGERDGKFGVDERLAKETFRLRRQMMNELQPLFSP